MELLFLSLLVSIIIICNNQSVKVLLKESRFIILGILIGISLCWSLKFFQNYENNKNKK
jgi:hypothetical protein